MDNKAEVIYFDNAATTKVVKEAADAAFFAMTESYGNPAAVHRFGKQAEKIVEDSREIIKTSLGAKKGTVIFTSGGTESINWALLQSAEKNKHRGKHIVSTAIEHAATLETLKHLAQKGYEVTLVSPEKDGSVSLEKIMGAVREDTIVLSLMVVCNETGARLPVEEAARLAKEKNKNILVHFDAVQAYLKVPFDIKYADFVSLSGHKIGAMKGVGALYTAENVKIAPMLYGGYQDKGLRSGTQAVPQIASFGAAAKVRSENFDENFKKLTALREHLIKGLKSMDKKAFVTEPRDFAPHIVSVGFEKGRSEVIIRVLADHGIFVAGGSACSKGKKSHVLAAMNLGGKIIDSSLRISFCPENTVEEIDIFIEALEKALKMFG